MTQPISSTQNSTSVYFSEDPALSEATAPAAGDGFARLWGEGPVCRAPAQNAPSTASKDEPPAENHAECRQHAVAAGFACASAILPVAAAVGMPNPVTGFAAAVPTLKCGYEAGQAIAACSE
jgi:hypothetical protein